MGTYPMTTTSLMYVWMAVFVAMVETGLETICLAVQHNDCKVGKQKMLLQVTLGVHE